MADNSKLRTRNFATIVYPESAPADWKERLADLHIPCFVSPLHDSDYTFSTDRQLGTPIKVHKKEHYHVQFMFDGVKSEKQCRDIISSIGGVGCEPLNSIRAYARYLCHLDDYDKAQYNPSDVLSFGGANYLDVIGTMSDKFRMIQEMLHYIRENKIISFSDLVDYAADNNSMWFDALCNNCSYFIKEYIKSYTWKNYSKIEQ